jgi:acyl-CoA reductase-like NAD-dependent aldehyde dehydrogenase
VRVIDFTGSTAYGEWLERHALQAEVYTEKAASTASSSTRPTTSPACARTSPFSLSLYSGQMCTTPQNLFVPRDGIETDQGHKSFDEVAPGRRPPSRRCSGTSRGLPRCSAPS